MSLVSILKKTRQISKELGEPEWVRKLRQYAALELERRGMAEVEDFDFEKKKISRKNGRGHEIMDLEEAFLQMPWLASLQFHIQNAPSSYLLALALFCSGRLVYFPKGEEGVAFLEDEDGLQGYFFDLVVFDERSASTIIQKSKRSLDCKTAMACLAGSMAKADVCLIGKNGAEAESRFGLVLDVGKKAHARLFRSNISGKKHQDSFLIVQGQEGSKCEHYNASLFAGFQKMRMDSSHLHLAPSTYSRSVFHFGLSGRSEIEVEAKVTIEQNAPFSDTHLLAKSLLLPGQPRSKVVPQLFVRNADVSAGHGSAFMPIDENELFYLQSRGMSEEEGKKMVLEGFLAGIYKPSNAGKQIANALACEMEKRINEVFENHA